MSKKTNQKNEVLEQNLQSQDETSKPKNETEFLNEEETLNEEQSQENEVLEAEKTDEPLKAQKQDESQNAKNEQNKAKDEEAEFLNEEETLNEEQSQENEVLNNKEQDEKEENADKEQKVLKDIQCIDIASFEYIGKEPFNYRGFSGKIYTFKQGDIILIPNDERANYLSYKKTLFKSVNPNDLL